jgi:tripartite-type tricarboxylate transporter receptor subunit TctC
VSAHLAGLVAIVKRARAALICVIGLTLSGFAAAQEYPSKPVRMLVGFPPASALDLAARVVSGKLSELLHQSVVVDNRAGAAGNIAAELAARSRPDGYTLLFGANGALAINPALHRNLSFDSLKDFAPIGKVAETANVLVVSPASAAVSVEQLIAIARAKPLLGGSSGSGSPGHLALALFNHMAGTKITHVPYKGSNPALLDLMAGTIQVAFATMATAAPLIQTGRLKALGVAAAKRSALLPDLPTVSEAGLRGFEVSGWYAVLAPANTPQPLVQRLNTELNKALALGDVRQNLVSLGLEVTPSTPDAFTAFLKSEMLKWGNAVKISGAKVD